jgi:hypothetical protein
MPLFRSLAVPALGLLLAAPAAAQPSVHQGTLDANDPVRPGGAPYDAYTFEVEEDQLVTVRMESQTFDTYLIVRSPSGVETISDDFAGTMVSQVDLVAAEPGEWTAWASAYAASLTGDYTLTIRPAGIGRSQLVQGRLDRQDAQALKGEYFDTHTFESGGGGQVLIQLTSLGFDGFLVVTSPDGTVVREEGATAENLQVGPLPAARGRWRVDVTTAYAGMVGAYDLKFIAFERRQD